MSIGFGVSLSGKPSGLGPIGSVTGEDVLTSGRPSDWNANATTVFASFVEAGATPVDAVYADVVDNSASFEGKWHDAVAVGAGEIWEAHCLVDYAGVVGTSGFYPLYVAVAGLPDVWGVASVVTPGSAAPSGYGANTTFISILERQVGTSQVWEYAIRFLAKTNLSMHCGMLASNAAGMNTIRCGNYQFFRVQ